MAESQQICSVCKNELSEGVCIYCTASDLVDLKAIVQTADLKQPEPAEFIWLVEMSTGKRHVLDSPRVRIGRDARCQIVINDDVYVSRFHAFVTFEDGQFWIQDLGSKNGTLLNRGHILDREVLNRGDVLTVGRTDFRIE